MEGGFTAIFNVSIDFQQSHTFFPTIILWILLILGLAILVIFGIPFIREVKRGQRTLSFFVKNFDKLRLFGTLVLMIVYVLAMSHVGEFFPNMGFGFLFASMPFMFVLSLLYAHNINRQKIMLITLNSIIIPGVCWYVLGNLFNMSLP